ncbi:MAG: MFS transporter [Planctomycetota bacterium]|jgi:MFS family permease
MPTDRHHLERTVRLYPWLHAFHSAYFWLPVFFLYFSKHLPLSEVLLLESIYYAAVFVIEVPSGWISDRFGRRRTLIVAALANIAACGLFAAGDSLAWFMPAQVLLATSIAFMSGTDTALHYDALTELGRAGEYDDREARVVHIAALATAAAAMLGGLVGALSLGATYTLSLLAAVGALAITLLMSEPSHRVEPDDETGLGLLATIRRCLAMLRSRQLAWLFGFAVIAYALNHVPYHLNQPYVDLVITSLEGTDDDGARFGSNASTPIVLGLMTTVIMMFRSWAGRRSIAIRDRIGLVPLLLGSMALQVGLAIACAAVLHWSVAIALFARSVGTGLQAAPLNAAIVPRVNRTIRATFLSVKSLAGRLSYASLLFTMSWATRGEGSETMDWESLSKMALTGAVVGVAALVVLGVFVPRAVGASARD